MTRRPATTSTRAAAYVASLLSQGFSPRDARRYAEQRFGRQALR